MANKNATEDVLAELRNLLRSEAFPPGKRLPTERALSEMLGVNRATLRKALAHLEAEKVITRHVGRGTFVGVPPETPETMASKASPIELMDARLALEPVVAREAALRARKENLEQLRVCLTRSEAADEYASFEEWDVAFHRALAEATQNPIFVMVMEVMRQMRGSAEWERLKRASFNPELRNRYKDEHRAIFQAVEARDHDAAAVAMFQHMQTVRDAIAGSVWAPNAAKISRQVPPEISSERGKV